MTDFAIESTFPRPRHDLLSRILRTLSVWHERRLARLELAGLSDATLHDIGVSRSLISCEIEKPFWRA